MLNAQAEVLQGPFKNPSGYVGNILWQNFESSPIQWQVIQPPDSDLTTGYMTQSTVFAHTGNASVRAVPHKSFSGRGFGLQKLIAVTGGQKYVISGFVRRGPGSYNAYLGGVALNSSGAGVAGAYVLSCPSWVNQWQFLYTVLDVPTGVTSVRLSMIVDGQMNISETAYFDNVAVTSFSLFQPPLSDTLTVDNVTTSNVTPTVTGNLVLNAHTSSQVTSVTALVNGQTYSGTFNSSTGSLSAFVGNALVPGNSYDVVFTVNFNDGTSRQNVGCGLPVSKVAITCQPFVDGVIIPTDPSGVIGVDFRYDGGSYQGQVGVFSLAGMCSNTYDLNTNSGQNAFVKEAVRRVRTNTTQGRIIIDDILHRARFDGQLPGDPANHNSGSTYSVAPDPVPFQEFTLSHNQTYGIMMIPNGTFAGAEVELNKADPDEFSQVYPLLSLAMSSDNGVFYVGQSVSTIDSNSDQSIIAFEDFRGGDGDYNDIILRISRATVDMGPLTQYITDSAWTNSTLGLQILNPQQ